MLAALLVAVPAGAATVRWNPFDGGDTPGPSVSSRAPDPALVAQLGILRRPQNDSDRRAAEGAAPFYRGQGFRGVQLDHIRAVDPARGLVLVPFEEPPVPRGPDGRPVPGIEVAPGLCLVRPVRDGYAGGCYTRAEIESSRALSSDDDVVLGVVPDGVARVRLIRGERSGVAQVRDNFFRAEAPVPTAPLVVEWLAADGSLVRRHDLSRPPGR